MPTNSLMVFQPFADTNRSLKPPDAVSIIADDSSMQTLMLHAISCHHRLDKAAFWQLHRLSRVFSRSSDTT